MVKSEVYCSWAWTAQHVAAIGAAERQRETGLILPPQVESDRTHLAHFSTLRDGEQYSWLWLFDNAYEAVAVKQLPSHLSDDDPVGDLIGATLPDESLHGQTCYLQSVPRSWFKQIPFAELGIHEIWFGFKWKVFCEDRSLRAATSDILSAEEFMEALRR
jgi:hypothetical protein